MFHTQLQQLQFLDKYARWNDKESRRETWQEAVSRVVDHLRWLSDDKLPDTDYQDIYAAISNLEVLPSMRLLAMAGEAARTNAISGYNCASVAIDSYDALPEILFILMAGTGVGFSVESRYISQLPAIEGWESGGADMHFYEVQDSAEGWANALKFGLSKWVIGQDVTFDYRKIRPAGSRLKTKGGTASGSEPLRRLLDFARATMIDADGRQLTPLEVHDICCMIGDCVISGGVRRSSLLSLFDSDNYEMLTCKNGDLTGKEYRYNANNSAVWEYPMSKAEVGEFFRIMDSGQRGEPGIFSRYGARITLPQRRAAREFGTNPCLSGDTLVRVADDRHEVSIQELATIGEDVPVYCYDDNGELAVRWMRSPRLSGKSKPIVIITFYDGTQIQVTPRHKFRLATGEYIEAHKLQHGTMLDARETFASLAVPDKPNNSHCEICKTPLFGQKEASICSEQCSHKQRDRFAKNQTLAYEHVYVVQGIRYSEPQDVYNGTVDEYHNFFVRGQNNQMWLNNLNCGEIVLRHTSELGGGQFCNLSSVVARQGDTLETLLEKTRIATIIGTIQAMATDFPFLRPGWRANCEDERILGVDITGQMDSPAVRLPVILQAMKQVALKTNAVYADKLGINQATAVTCTKPSGNSSVLVDCSPGVHARHARHYIRRVRLDSNSPVTKTLQSCNYPLSPENGQTVDDAITWVAEFPIAAPEGAIVKGQLSALEQLRHWLTVKTNWAEHQVSATITYRPNELGDIIEWVHDNQEEIGGLSFLPLSDARYAQMPYEEISQERYDQMVATLPHIDFDLLPLIEYTNMTNGSQQLACVPGQDDC